MGDVLRQAKGRQGGRVREAGRQGSRVRCTEAGLG